MNFNRLLKQKGTKETWFVFLGNDIARSRFPVTRCIVYAKKKLPWNEWYIADYSLFVIDFLSSCYIYIYIYIYTWIYVRRYLTFLREKHFWENCRDFAESNGSCSLVSLFIYLNLFVIGIDIMINWWCFSHNITISVEQQSFIACSSTDLRRTGSRWIKCFFKWFFWIEDVNPRVYSTWWAMQEGNNEWSKETQIVRRLHLNYTKNQT